MSDIAATLDGTDIDFSDRLISGLSEHRQAALSRLSNEVTMTDSDYGIDLALELGKVGAIDTIGIRASDAIMKDERFVSAELTNTTQRQNGDLVEVTLSFEVVSQEGVTFSLDVLVANGEVVLVP